MTYDIDRTLAEIQRLSSQIESMPPGPDRDTLEEQREQVRHRARLAADASRPLTHLQAELHNVEEQLAAMDAELIKPAMNEHYKMITDPSAYRRRINQRIAEGDADRQTGLQQRRDELLAALREAQTD